MQGFSVRDALARLWPRPAPKAEPLPRAPEPGQTSDLAGPLAGAALGTSGLNAFGGYVAEAYTEELRWPGAYEIYNDMRRRNPTLRTMLNVVNLMARLASWKFEPASDADGDQMAADFGNECLDDLGASLGDTIEDALTALPFGWSWQETLYGVRRPGWRSPDDDGWESHYADGRVGWRAFAYRRQSSWYKWELADKTGRLTGMWQMDSPNPAVLLPLDRALHFRPYRDGDNPEGMALFEAAHEPYYYLKNLQIIQGIGFERSLVGFPVFKTETVASSADKTALQRAAATMLASIEKSHLVLPPGIVLELLSVAHSNADAIMAAIQHYEAKMLQLVLADFTVLGSGNVGSWALSSDKSDLFLMAVNGLLASLAGTLNAGPVRQLYRYNQFAGMTRPPNLVPSKVHKPMLPKDLAEAMEALGRLIPLDGNDLVNVVARSEGLLADRTPDDFEQPEEQPEEEQPDPNPEPDKEGEDDSPESEGGDNPEDAELSADARAWLAELAALPEAEREKVLGEVRGV